MKAPPIPPGDFSSILLNVSRNAFTLLEKFLRGRGVDVPILAECGFAFVVDDAATYYGEFSPMDETVRVNLAHVKSYRKLFGTVVHEGVHFAQHRYGVLSLAGRCTDLIDWFERDNVATAEFVKSADYGWVVKELRTPVPRNGFGEIRNKVRGRIADRLETTAFAVGAAFEERYYPCVL